MPRPSERTRSKRRINKALPGGNSKTDFRGKTATVSHCSLCGQKLTGVSNASPLKTRKVNRGRRRIWRLHGGQLCHSCLKMALKQTVRTLD